jgi:hypothetical protein
MTDAQKASDVIERFEIAVESLATGPGDVRSRLENAFLSIMIFRENDLPKDIQKDFSWVVKSLTKKESRYRGEGSIHSTLSQMKNVTGSKIASKIFVMYKMLLRLKLHDK